MRKQEKVTNIITKYICDECGKPSAVRICCMCGKDLCEKCLIYHHWQGDTPVIYCKDCLDIGESYLEQLSLVDAKYEQDIEALEKEWKGKCVERRRINIGRIKDEKR